MTFILWTLVWWGLTEIREWRTDTFRRAESKKLDVLATLTVNTIQWSFFIFLYIYFIK